MQGRRCCDGHLSQPRKSGVQGQRKFIEHRLEPGRWHLSCGRSGMGQLRRERDCARCDHCRFWQPVAERNLGAICQSTSEVRLDWIRRSEEHTSELQSRFDLVCRLLLEKKKQTLLTSLQRTALM